MRLFSTVMLIFALVSQGAVARIHLMPEMDHDVGVAMTHHQAESHDHSAHQMKPHCDSADMTGNDCCESMAQPPDCHDAASPCEGECGHCKVFSPSALAILDTSLSLPALVPQAIPTPSQSFLSVVISTDNPPPIC